MATAGSEVTTSRIRTASQARYNRTICSCEYISSEEAFHPRDAVSSPPPAHLSSDDIASGDFEDHALDSQARWACSGSDCLIHHLGLPHIKPSSRSYTLMTDEVGGTNVERPRENIIIFSMPRCPVPVGAVPAPMPARPTSDDIVLCDLGHHLFDCQAYRDLSEELSHPMQCPGSPSTKSSSRPNSSEMADEAIGTNDEPTSDPTQTRYPASLLPSTKTARYFGYVTSIPSRICHRWFGSLLGLSSLILAIVSLLMFTVRSYRMAVWTTRNDELQACTGLIQAERPIGPNCERLLSEGPQDPPYNLSRRMTNSRGPGSFLNLPDTSVVGTDLFLPVETKQSAWLILASIFALISLADLLLNLLRQTSRTEDDFERLAAIEIATMPHHGQRSTMIDDDHPDAGFPSAHTDPSVGLRRRIRLRQEVQDEISIEDQSVGEESLPYSMARYLNQPPRHGALGEMPFLS